MHSAMCPALSTNMVNFISNKDTILVFSVVLLKALNMLLLLISLLPLRWVIYTYIWVKTQYGSRLVGKMNN